MGGIQGFPVMAPRIAVKMLMPCLAGDLLPRFRRAGVAFGLAVHGWDAQVGQEAEHVVLAIAQAFQQEPAGRRLLAAAGDAPHPGQADAAGPDRARAGPGGGPTIT
jgi:hypothetical protein